MLRNNPIPGLALAVMILLVAARGLVAQGVIDQEYELKAAFLYNFGRYVEWPKNAVPGEDDTFVIGLVGPNPFGRALDNLAGKTVQGKKIAIRKFTSVKDYQPCHILFVSAEPDDKADEKTVEERVKAVLAKTRGAPVLLVSDSDELAEKGMMINFYIEENHLKLAINRDAAARAGLTISAKLLGLKGVVKIVRVGPPRGREDHAPLS